MQSVVLSVLAGLLRYVLAGAIGWLITNGIATPEQVEQLIAGLVGGVGLVAWLVWLKWKDKVTILTALAQPQGTTLDELKDEVKAGNIASVSTPSSVAPKVLPMIAAFVLATSMLAGCASIPVKQQVSAKHQTVHQALVVLDDAERALCQPKPAPLSNECASPTAAAIGLTNAKHQEFSRRLAAAFTLDAKVGVAVIAWRAGDPVPTDLSTLVRDAQDIAAVVNTITDNPLVDKAQTLIARLLQLVDAFKN